GPEDDPGSLGQGAFEVLRESGRRHRLACGDEPEQDVALRSAELLAGEDLGPIEVPHLAGDLRCHPRWVEPGNRPDATASGRHPGPGARYVVAERRDRAHAGHHDATRGWVGHRTSLPVRIVAAR